MARYCYQNMMNIRVAQGNASFKSEVSSKLKNYWIQLLFTNLLLKQKHLIELESIQHGTKMAFTDAR